MAVPSVLHTVVTRTHTLSYCAQHTVGSVGSVGSVQIQATVCASVGALEYNMLLTTRGD